MERKSASGLMVTLLLIGMLTLAFNTRPVTAEPRTWTVDDDGPADFQTIQEAIAAASAGDSISVSSGIYYEHLVVNKPLTLVGESKESTIVDGSKIGNVIEVTANNVVINRFTVQNSNSTQSYAGIKVSGRSCNITDNLVTKNKMGIFVTSQKSRIAKNIVTKNGQGIALYSSSEVTVEANNVSANTVGISLALSFNNIIVNNRAVNSSTGGHGITLGSNSFNNAIRGNKLMNNFHGMWLSSQSSDNSIVNNTIANNKLLGVELASSPDNIFYHNNFINNGLPPFAPSIKHIVIKNSTSIWDDGYPSGGNYWSDYIDVDVKSGPNQDQSGSDGIWDSPYVIDEENRDRYPLVNPPVEIPDLTPPITIDDYDGLWYTTDFTVTLTATDDLSGVAETYYKINDSPVKTVSVDGQPSITTEGSNNELEYWSVDKADNEESHHILTEIKLDKTKPTANAGQNQTVNVGSTVTFNASGSSDNLDVVSFEWDFGDGTTGTGMTSTHVYSEPKNYTVALTVKDGAGNSDLDSIIVTVVEPPLNDEDQTSPQDSSPWILWTVVAMIGIVIAFMIFRRRRKYRHRRRRKRKVRR